MTDLQLYILVAIPLVGILANTALFVNLATRMDTRFASLEAKVDTRIESLDSKVEGIKSKMDTRFDLVMGKLSELDTGVAVLEDRVMRGSQ